MQEEKRDSMENRDTRAGMSPEDDHPTVGRRFGRPGSIGEGAREKRMLWGWENVLKDLRHGIRVLLRAPGFTLAAVASLALGVGANTAVFSLVDRILLQPLPYFEPHRLATIWTENRTQNSNRQTSSYGNVDDWRRSTRTLEDVAIFDPASLIVSTDEPRRISGLLASVNLGSVLRVQPQIGRLFNPGDVSRADRVTILSHAAWIKYYAGAPDILGRKILIDGSPVEIIGVTPEGFYFPDKKTELWLPFVPPAGATAPRGVGPLRAIARLAPGISWAQAQSELSAISGVLEQEYAPNRGLGVRLLSLTDQMVGREVRNGLFLLLAAVGAVLLIACANVGNLLLARGLARQREFAMRLSLGATRRRLVIQLLIENVVLCVGAAGVGLVLAAVTLEGVRKWAPAGIPRLEEVTIDFRIFAFALVLSLASVCVFGLLPALQCTRRDAVSMLRNSSRDSTEAFRDRRLRNVLVIVEFALAVMLFAGAGLLVRSFMNLVAVDPGFRTENLLIAPVRLPASRPAGDAVPLATALVERVRALPGVSAVAVSQEAMLGDRNSGLIVSEQGPFTQEAPLRVPLAADAVTPEYFQVMDVPLRSGRPFSGFDGTNAPRVAIINETLARQLWPGEDPIGRRFRLGLNNQLPWITVVGIAADQRRQKLDRPPIAQVFWPWAQVPSRGMNVILRTATDSAGLVPFIRGAVRDIDPSIPFEPTMTMRQLLERTVAPRAFHTRLLTVFAAIALVLAGVGIFGLMHYSVTRRTHEIGIRTALGATSGLILKRVLIEGLTLATLGVAIGIGGAIVLFRTFSAVLFETSPADPISLATAAVALITVAMVACFVPALRASRIDPLVALRND